MRKEGFYSSGEFARMAHVTLRTIRFYDAHNILKPSFVNESGARFYTEEDLGKLQQILLLKYLGFSLEEIRGMLVDEPDYRFMLNTLNIQRKLVQERIEQMQLVEAAIGDATEAIEQNQSIEWSNMLNLIHLTGMEKSLRNQYLNASNISARIHLHALYSKNKQGWFPWVYEQCGIAEGMQILEIGCGDGSLWLENKNRIPKQIRIKLSDLSEGMLRDARRSLGAEDARFSFRVFDCHEIPMADESCDLVIANHVLFYCEDIPAVCREVFRVLKADGRFVCSTYSANHMKEVSELVSSFDDRIVLSADRLYEQFGLENGESILKTSFPWIEKRIYEDSLLVPDEEPLISYVLSCHGNQNQYILDHYKEFRSFVKKKTRYGFAITKEAGIFLCGKNPPREIDLQ